jgi:hypothetical protein
MSDTIILNAAEYQAELTERMNGVLMYASQLKQANSNLASLIDQSVGSFSLEKVIERALHVWLDRHCKTITKLYQGDTKETITRSDLEKELRELPRSLITAIQWNKGTDDDSSKEVANFISKYPFELLSETFTKKAHGLFDQGLVTIAEALLDDLGLRKYALRNIYKISKRHISFDKSVTAERHRWSSNYGYTTREKMARIALNIGLAEKQLGSYGLKPAFDALNAAMQESVIESGVTFGNKNNIVCRIFNSHIRISMTPDVFSGFMSFLIQHKKDETDVHLPLFDLTEAFA